MKFPNVIKLSLFTPDVSISVWWVSLPEYVSAYLFYNNSELSSSNSTGACTVFGANKEKKAFVEDWYVHERVYTWLARQHDGERIARSSVWRARARPLLVIV